MSEPEEDALIRPRSDDLFPDPDIEPAPVEEPGDQPGDDPRLFGDSAPEPDPIPFNHAKLAINLEDCQELESWIFKQGFPIHRQVTAAHLVTALSGMIRDDFRWLCYAMNQANRAPAPSVMHQALVARNVAILRDRDT